ncbi:catalase [Hyphomonas sp.]|uniref:catalase n=1 Tax=Hyphomonas sp. TaxID=87 RepID=UPI00391CCA01
MANKKKEASNALADPAIHIGEGGELHQVAGDGEAVLTTNQGAVISDDHNSLVAGPSGAVLLEDFVLREKIFHFDHERIPERVVHARGLAAHGTFKLTDSLADLTRAAILSDLDVETPVFVRFSTVAGNRGSADLARDVRGFAVKFYTTEGNWDLVGNNIPVFFIQDAMKFPDLVHAVKEEPDRGFPQAASAHDTFWDWIACTPESMHMVMWQMSDRTIPRSVRMMEGFGVHSFRLVSADGKSTFVKFHWKPRLGMQSVVWDEAVKINGADPDFHRRDLYNAIEDGDFPQWDLAVQLFDEDTAERLQFDHLDATKIIPEEIVPLRVIGTLTLNRNPANVFDETEQVAFCTQNIVPGIDFSDDPLLQGRNFSYLDTQLKRLGSPNFQQLPINAPKCPFANMQRDGHMQMLVHPQRVTYTPSLLDPSGPREDRTAGFRSFEAPMRGSKQRERSASFADHYSQARQFFMSQTDTEQDHIISALVFELSKVDALIVRAAILGHLKVIDEALAARVAKGLGAAGAIEMATPAIEPDPDVRPSAALSILKQAVPTLEGRCIGCLVTDGADAALIGVLAKQAEKAGAKLKIIAPVIGGVTLSDGSHLAAHYQLAGGPSVLFDAVVLMFGEKGADALEHEAAAAAFVHDAFQHLKTIGFSSEALPLLHSAGVRRDDAVIAITDAKSIEACLASAANGRLWAREPQVRTVY